MSNIYHIAICFFCAGANLGVRQLYWFAAWLIMGAICIAEVWFERRHR